MLSILAALNINGKKTLLLTNGTQENVYRSGRNITKVNVVEANKATTYDLVNNQVLLMQKGAVEQLVNSLN